MDDDAALFLLYDAETSELTLSGDFSIIIEMMIHSKPERHASKRLGAIAAAGGLAILVIGGVAGYGIGAIAQSPEASQVADPTTGWETYANRQHGYSIKYPSKLAAYLAADENSLIINAPGPSDTPLLRIDVYDTELEPSPWWSKNGRQRYPWLFNAALNHIELGNRYGALAGLQAVEVVAQRRTPGGTTLPASALLLTNNDRLFAVFDDTDFFTSSADEDDWRMMLSTFRFVPRENRR